MGIKLVGAKNFFIVAKSEGKLCENALTLVDCEGIFAFSLVLGHGF